MTVHQPFNRTTKRPRIKKRTFALFKKNNIIYAHENIALIYHNFRDAKIASNLLYQNHGVETRVAEVFIIEK